MPSNSVTFAEYNQLVLTYSTLLVALNSNLASDPLSSTTANLIQQCNATAIEIEALSGNLLSTNSGSAYENIMRQQIIADQNGIAESQAQIQAMTNDFNQYTEQYDITVLQSDMQSANYNIWKLIAFILVAVTAALMFTVFSSFN